MSLGWNIGRGLSGLQLPLRRLLYTHRYYVSSTHTGDPSEGIHFERRYIKTGLHELARHAQHVTHIYVAIAVAIQKGRKNRVAIGRRCAALCVTRAKKLHHQR